MQCCALMPPATRVQRVKNRNGQGSADYSTARGTHAQKTHEPRGPCVFHFARPAASVAPGDRLHLEIFLDPLDAPGAADAALLIAAKRQIAADRHTAIHRECAGADAVGNLQATLETARGNAAGQAVDAVIADADCILIILE